MKISIIASIRGWQTEALGKAARKLGISFEIRDITSTDKNEAQKLGDVVIWRSSSLDKFAERTTFLNLLNDKIIINHAIAKHPFLANKFFQQKYFERHSGVERIPTFKFKTKTDFLKAISKKEIQLPAIIKPDSGSQGKNITLVKSKKELEKLDERLEAFTVQKFINNQGDYRVLMLGGKMLGAIKRTASQNSFLNNLAQGGSAEKITDPVVLEELRQIASKAASIFDLTFCGIDIIYDTQQKKYYFLEINTVPEWRGFQKSTGIKVAEELVGLCVALHDRQKKPASALVENYYRQNFSYLYDKQFHFASRMHLWLHDKDAKKKLGGLRRDYLASPTRKIREILSGKNGSSVKKMLNNELREKYFKKYPKILSYNRALFLNLFASTVFGRDLRRTIANIIPKKKLLSLYDKLSTDKESIAVLSTHAINFFYLLQYYLDKQRNKLDILNPELLFSIATNSFLGKLKNNFDLQIYLLTHCIIGESYFYSQTINDPSGTYLKMIKFLENLIWKNYFNISLDNKLEFLVCAELCQYTSHLRQVISAEAERSLSNTGNFLIDSINDVSKKNISKNSFISAEHRNVLFVMANNGFVLNNRKQ